MKIHRNLFILAKSYGIIKENGQAGFLEEVDGYERDRSKSR